MSKFSERFNAWLITQGKEPFSERLYDALDRAAEETVQWMQDNKAEIVASIQEVGAALASGQEVDTEAQAKALVEKTLHRHDNGETATEDDWREAMMHRKETV